MMNDRFANYVTSAAFHISLSAPQIAALDAVVRHGEEWIHFQVLGRNDHTTPWRALERRGLVYFYGKEEGNQWLGLGWKEPAWVVTDAGKLVHALLIEAGLVAAEPKAEAA